MRAGPLVVVVVLGLAAGCERPPQTTGTAGAPIATGPAAPADGTGPRFPSEFVVIDPKGVEVARVSNGGAEGGPQAAMNPRHAVGGGRSAAVYEVEVVAHRGGADVLKFSYTAPTGAGSATTSKEVRYTGGRMIMVQDEHGTAVLRPPTK